MSVLVSVSDIFPDYRLIDRMTGGWKGSFTNCQCFSKDVNMAIPIPIILFIFSFILRETLDKVFMMYHVFDNLYYPHLVGLGEYF